MEQVRSIEICLFFARVRVRIRFRVRVKVRVKVRVRVRVRVTVRVRVGVRVMVMVGVGVRVRFYSAMCSLPVLLCNVMPSDAGVFEFKPLSSSMMARSQVGE